MRFRKRAAIFAVIILMISVSFVQAMNVVETVTVGSLPWDIAYDYQKGEVFVSNQVDGTVSVVSDSNNSVVATIPVGNDPEGLAYNPDKGEIFVADYGSNTTSIISDSTNSVIATIAVGSGPSNIVYDSKVLETFISNTLSNTVSVIKNNVVTANIPIISPYGLAYDPEKNEIFVSSGFGDAYGGNTVFIISDSTNSIVGNVKVGSYPQGLAYDNKLGEVFVANVNSNSVSVVSDSSDSVLTNIPVGMNPWGVIYVNDSNEVIVTNNGKLSVISDSTNTVIGNVSMPSGVLNGCYDFGKSEIFVTNYYVPNYKFNQYSNSISIVPASSLQSSTPSVPELSWLAIIPLMVSMLSVGVLLRCRKTANLKQ